MKTERNNRTRLKVAGDYASRLGVFRARDMVTAGYSREYLRRLVNQEKVRRLGRGLYASADYDGDQNQTLVEAATRVPRGVVCLLSALQFHGIGTQAPHYVWLALPRGINRPREVQLPLRYCQFSGAAYTLGIEEHTLSGGTVKIYSPAKTVADCFKYRQKIWPRCCNRSAVRRLAGKEILHEGSRDGSGGVPRQPSHAALSGDARMNAAEKSSDVRKSAFGDRRRSAW